MPGCARAARSGLLHALLAGQPPAVIVAEGLEAPGSLVRARRTRGTAAAGIARCPRRASSTSLRDWLARTVAASTEMHGVLMDVLGMGVLISGESGPGQERAGAGADQPRRTGWSPTTSSSSSAWRPTPSRAAARRCCRTCSRCAGSGLLDIKTDLRRDRGAAQDEAAADRAPGEAQHDGERLPAAAAGGADPGRARRGDFARW